MYNRYIPQSDGSFHRSRLPEQLPEAPPQNPTIVTSAEPVHTPPPEEPPLKREPRRSPPPYPHRSRPKQPQKEPADSGILSFLRSLLPGNFDSGDLLVVLLLLLMSGDCAEDQNTALLTLALYLFL